MFFESLRRSLFPPRFRRDGEDPADIVIANAMVFTGREKTITASSVAVRKGRIIYVGDDRGAAVHVGPGTRLIDAGGRVLTPGFVDNHCHVAWIGGLMALMTKKLYEASNLEEVLETVLEHSRKNPELPFVSGVGWKFEHLPGGAPDRKILDRVIKDRPVFLMSLCGQCGWLNTRALELASQRNPEAFRRLAPRSDASGVYTGALDHFHSFSPLDFFTEEEIAPAFETAVPLAISEILDEAVSVGVTTLHDVQLYRNFIPHLLRYRERGVFDKVRLRGALYIDSHDLENGERLKENLAWWVETAKESDERLVLGDSVKLYIDGTAGNHTAFMLQPYTDQPSTRGKPDWTQEDFDRVIELVDAMGLQACTHSCGDAGIRRVINSYERACRINGNRDARHRVEHCELPVPEDRERMARWNILASMQPAHFFGVEGVEEILGSERLNRMMPWRSLEKAGVEISFGSDWCAGPVNPVYGLMIAATRLNYKGKRDWGPEERISLENAVRHWTFDSARALKMDDDIGSVEVGKCADLVLWGTSPFKLTSTWFLLTHDLELGALDDLVDMTMVDGKVVFEKGAG
jgi:hypothetical protein